MHAHRHSGWAGDSKQVSITGAVMHHTNSGGGVAVSDWQRAMALAENKKFISKSNNQPVANSESNSGHCTVRYQQQPCNRWYHAVMGEFQKST